MGCHHRWHRSCFTRIRKRLNTNIGRGGGYIASCGQIRGMDRPSEFGAFHSWNAGMDGSGIERSCALKPAGPTFLRGSGVPERWVYCFLRTLSTMRKLTATPNHSRRRLIPRYSHSSTAASVLMRHPIASSSIGVHPYPSDERSHRVVGQWDNREHRPPADGRRHPFIRDWSMHDGPPCL